MVCVNIDALLGASLLFYVIIADVHHTFLQALDTLGSLSIYLKVLFTCVDPLNLNKSSFN